MVATIISRKISRAKTLPKVLTTICSNLRNSAEVESNHYISLSETGEIVEKYRERYKITVDYRALEKAIAAGDVKGVELIPHQKVLEMIASSPCAAY